MSFEKEEDIPTYSFIYKSSCLRINLINQRIQCHRDYIIRTNREGYKVKGKRLPKHCPDAV